MQLAEQLILVTVTTSITYIMTKKNKIMHRKFKVNLRHTDFFRKPIAKKDKV